MNKFDRIGSNAATFAGVREMTAKNDMTFRMVSAKHLLRCIYNKEDVSYTEDIEKSIDEIGFIDPIEVMPVGGGMAERGRFKCLEGAGAEHRYMILSGHRRFEAALNKGIEEIPCAQINRKFASDAEIENYVLMANCHRDSAKDPLLLYKRYIAHRDYFADNYPKMKTTDIDKAIAPRMGTSERNIRRFRAIDGNIIDSLLDMVRKGEIALSGLDRAASLAPGQQTEVYNLFQSMLDERANNGEDREISRSEANRVIKAYKSGSESQAGEVASSGLNSESEGEYKAISLATVAKTDDERARFEQTMTSGIVPVQDAQGDNAGNTDDGNNERFERSHEDKTANSEKRNKVMGSLGHEQLKTRGNHKSLLWLLDKLSDTRGTQGCDWSGIQSDDEAADKAQAIINAVMDLIDEIKSIASQYPIENVKADGFVSISNAVK